VYLDIFESTTLSFNIQLLPTRIQQIQQQIWIFLLRVDDDIFEFGKKKLQIQKYLDTMIHENGDGAPVDTIRWN